MTNKTLEARIDEHIRGTLKWLKRNHPTLLTEESLLLAMPNNTDHYLSFRFEPFTIQEIRLTIDDMIDRRCTHETN